MRLALLRVAIAIILPGVACFASAQRPAPGNSYRRGIEAFQAGHYAQALKHFRDAAHARHTSARLRYNIAVTEFRLRDYRRARVSFEKLLDSPDWRDLAVYNIAVIDERTGHLTAALRGYRRLAQSALNDRLRTLAATRRDEVARRLARRAATKPWLVLIDLSGGYDSNAASAATDLKNRVDTPEDAFAETLVYGQYYLRGHHRDGTRLYGLGYYQKYRNQHDYDIGIYSVGAAHEHPLGAFDTTEGIMVSFSRLGADRLATQTQLTLAAARRFGHHRLELAYKPSYFAASGTYPQLEGWQQRLQLQWRYTSGPLRLKTTMALEHNDRSNLTEGILYYDYSPNRAELAVDASYRVVRSVRLEGKIKYTHSDYSDPNRLIDTDGRFRVATRNSNAVTYTARVSWDVTTHWSLQSEYQYSQHRDTFALYRYHKRVAKLTAEFVY